MEAATIPREVTPRLELRGVTKRFPGVVANDGISLSVVPGAIQALLGENGAGKSTLVKIIYGVFPPDSGELFFDGAPISLGNPRAARRLGIGMVFQHFSLFEALSVLENIALGLDARIGRRKLEEEIRRILATYGLTLDPRRTVSTLSVGERQRIEIVRTLLLKPKLLIMDEPTSVLTPQEVEQLFGTLRQLASEGCSILYISHKLHEVVALCDKATILRGGRRVAECDPRRETSRSMAELMIGANLKTVTRGPEREFGEPRLVARSLSLPKRDDHGTTLSDISFSVRAGEILGVAGVAGNGQNELMAALDGEAETQNEMLWLDGAAIGAASPSVRRQRGLCTVPEERNGHAAVPDLTLALNAALTARRRLKLMTAGFLMMNRASAYAGKVISAFAVKATGPQSAAGSLSGGNLQKFIMGREILQEPGAIVVSQPTWGVDAGASAAIRQALADLAARGCAVLVISQDLDELLELCDSLVVINVGRLSRPMRVADASIEEIGLLMGGVHGETAPEPILAERVHAH